MIRDIVEEIKKIKGTTKELRSFGLVVGGVFLAIGAFLLWRDRESYMYFLAPGAALAVLGLLHPVLLRPLHKIWMAIAVILGWFMTRLILIALFYLVITPFALIAKISGKRFLELKMDKSAKSYWNYRNRTERPKEDYLRQF